MSLNFLRHPCEGGGPVELAYLALNKTVFVAKLTISKYNL